jgi:hypothetical protein
MYVRFVIRERDPDSDQQTGLFSALYALERDEQLEPYQLDWFRALERWFNDHLPRPARLNWSTRPNAPRRAITWLKLSATEHVVRMRELAALLEHHDVCVDELRTDKPGYVVYEDAFQVAAIPFSHETW